MGLHGKGSQERKVDMGRLGKAIVIIIALAAIALVAGFLMFSNTNLGS